MGSKSKIEWTDSTWNPTTGCTKVSSGCANCYAEVQAQRLQRMGQANYKDGFKPTMQPHMLDAPKRWSRPRRIFVNSMSDLFHADFPLDYIKQVFQVMADCPQHLFQVLTKRTDRLAKVAHELPWPPNVWIGVSVETAAVVGRIDALRKVPTPNRFLSCEPLVGSVGTMNLDGIAWVIAGGESGPGARLVCEDWVREIRDACQEQGALFFFKQWGAVVEEENGAVTSEVRANAKLTGVWFPGGSSRVALQLSSKYALRPLLDGRLWQEMPAMPVLA